MAIPPAKQVDMSTPPRVSVVTITFNQESFIEATLDGLLAQDFDAVEFLLSDDCSTDRTPEILARYQAAHPHRFRLNLRSANVGAAANFIETIRWAQGDYVAFCDGDDYWTDTQKLRKQVDHLDANPDCTVCFHPVTMFDGGAAGGPGDFRYPSADADEDLTCDRLLVDNFIATSSVMYRRQDYASLRTDIMPADWYVHLFHAARGGIAMLPDAMAAYRRHPGGLWTGAEQDPYLLYHRYGIERVALQDAVCDLFAHDEDKRAIVARSLAQAFRYLMEGDATYGEDRAVEAVRRYPRAVLECLSASLAQGDVLAAKAEDLWATLIMRNEETERLVARVADLRRKLQKSRSDLRGLRAEHRTPAGGAAVQQRALGRLARALPAGLRRLARR